MPKARVLVIDDDPRITNLLKEYLSFEGCEVETVHMAEEGYTKATQSPPDLILLDVMLPDATGYQMVGRFRENPVTKLIPIIMMTGSARHSNQQKIAKDMGANAYVLKPFDVVQVGEQVHELLKQHHPEMTQTEEPQAQEPQMAIPPIEILHHDAPEAWDAMPDPEPEISKVWAPIPKPAIKSSPTTPAPEITPALKKSETTFAPGKFALHMDVTFAKTDTNISCATTFVVGKWMLLLCFGGMLLGAVLIGFVWVLTARGYFLPH